MTPQAIVEPGAVASDPSAQLSRRIAAVAQLGASYDANAVPLLKRLFARRTGTAAMAMNWDPAAAERVVQLHAIAALHRLGDDSELARIPTLAAAAGRILQGADDERRNAVAVITAVGSVTVIRDLIAALANLAAPAAANVIEVLDTLRLPEAPVRQSLAKFGGVQLEVTGVTASLGELIGLLLSVGRRSVETSSGVKRMLASGGGQSGKTKLQGAKMPYLLQDLLPDFGLDYYVDGGRAVICTFAEAAELWRNWWSRYGARLSYSQPTRTYILAPG